MIVTMSKVEIAGPKDLLPKTLGLLRELGIFQIEPGAVGFIEEGEERYVRSLAFDEKAAVERAYLDSLRRKIDELLSYLPKVPVRESYIDPAVIVDAVARTVERHVSYAKDRSEALDARQKERSELERYGVFLEALSSLLGSTKETPDLDFIGFTIREPDLAEQIHEVISRITDRKFGIQTETAEDGTLVGLITVEKGIADRVRKTLSDEQVPELTFPAAFGSLTFPEKMAYVQDRTAAVTAELGWITDEMSRFAHRWAPLYRSARSWLDDHLSILKTTAFAFETHMCFFVHGWMPQREVNALRQKLDQAFGPKVVLVDRELREEDLERVPIVLRNPAYFRPFELLTSLLPLPAYTSYDPTPFIGIFFPVFFGIILGDAGYGLVLIFLALALRKRFPQNRAVRDGATVLLISSLYALLFGICFAEFFGDLPERLFHVRPLCLDRRTAIVPMMLFALAVGTAHIILGLLLGSVSAFRRKVGREGLSKILNVVIIVCIIAVVAALFGFFPQVLTRPLVLVILFLTPVLFFAGGVLAPLELLKTIGNIISYLRIMAIGLTSVLLAFVANTLGGLTGDVVTGVAVAGLLHLLNIVLGVFSPAIHSLRLHYVEFFSKFIEHGGRKFEPLKR